MPEAIAGVDPSHYIRRSLIARIDSYASFEHGGNRSDALEELLRKGMDSVEEEMSPSEHRAWIAHREGQQ